MFAGAIRPQRKEVVTWSLDAYSELDRVDSPILTNNIFQIVQLGRGLKVELIWIALLAQFFWV